MNSKAVRGGGRANLAILVSFAAMVGCRGNLSPIQRLPSREPVVAENKNIAPTGRLASDSSIGAPAEAEYTRVKKRFEDPQYQAQLGQTSWSAMHMGEEPVHTMIKALFVSLAGSGKFDFEASVREAGGIEAYKDRIASYLSSSDVMARGTAALALAIVGDPKYVDALIGLVRSKSMHVHLTMLDGYDRGMAMVALALLGAKQYRAEIELHKVSKLKYESEGAEAALMLMDAEDIGGKGAGP